jgi:hypothetical protein
MQGAATTPERFSEGAIPAGGPARDPACGGVSSNSAEVDVLRKSLSAVMLEHHAQAKKLASLAVRCSELEQRLLDIECSASWVAIKRLRDILARHRRLHRLITTIRRAIARP